MTHTTKTISSFFENNDKENVNIEYYFSLTITQPSKTIIQIMDEITTKNKAYSSYMKTYQQKYSEKMTSCEDAWKDITLKISIPKNHEDDFCLIKLFVHKILREHNIKVEERQSIAIDITIINKDKTEIN